MACSKQKDPKIVALLPKLDEGSCTQVVSAIDVIIERLEAIGLAYRLSIPPELMGVNPKNRNGYGLSPVEVHALGADIVKIGWSWAACAHAVAVEDDPQQTIASFSEQLSIENPGLAHMTKSKIKFGSLSCSHTSAFLAAVKEGVETDEGTIAVDGRLSAANLGNRDPELNKALAQGLNWTVLRAEVPEMYESLCDHIQHAKNATGGIVRRES